MNMLHFHNSKSVTDTPAQFTFSLVQFTALSVLIVLIPSTNVKGNLFEKKKSPC